MLFLTKDGTYCDDVEACEASYREKVLDDYWLQSSKRINVPVLLFGVLRPALTCAIANIAPTLTYVLF